MDTLRQSLVAAYLAGQWTVDQLACSQEARDHFRALLFPEHYQISNDDLIRELLFLRKSGRLSRKHQRATP